MKLIKGLIAVVIIATMTVSCKETKSKKVETQTEQHKSCKKRLSEGLLCKRSQEGLLCRRSEIM